MPWSVGDEGWSPMKEMEQDYIRVHSSSIYWLHFICLCSSHQCALGFSQTRQLVLLHCKAKTCFLKKDTKTALNWSPKGFLKCVQLYDWFLAPINPRPTAELYRQSHRLSEQRYWITICHARFSIPALHKAQRQIKSNSYFCIIPPKVWTTCLSIFSASPSETFVHLSWIPRHLSGTGHLTHEQRILHKHFWEQLQGNVKNTSSEMHAT